MDGVLDVQWYTRRLAEAMRKGTTKNPLRALLNGQVQTKGELWLRVSNMNMGYSVAVTVCLPR